ncbi:MAG: hypothetical protein AAGA48_02865 [Myxococcota bacterium]
MSRKGFASTIVWFVWITLAMGCIGEEDDCSRRETCATDSGTFTPTKDK